MHPICSWMATIDLADDLSLMRLEEDRFSRYAILWHKHARRRSEIDWPITRDLAVRAHLALENRVRRRLPVQMRLEKRIPVGGGMGGGSSNAAAMLLGVNRLYELGLDADDLSRVGATLGSDVPFFVQALAAVDEAAQNPSTEIPGRHAIVEGLGDRIEPLPARPPLHAVVIFPQFPCPTGAVYRAFDELLNSAPHSLRTEAVRLLAGAPDRLDPAGPFNDLAPAAMKVAPGLSALSRMIASLAERPAHVTGSGSTLFVLCDDPLHAECLAAAIEQRFELPALPVRTM